MSETTDRKPIADGERYCSPRCGFGCSRAGFDRATDEARLLATRLGGAWKPEVWENGGWHYRATNGEHAIHVKTVGSRLDDLWTVTGYWADLRFQELPMFNNGIQVIAHADDPNDALGFAVQDARTIIGRMEETLAALSEQVPA